MNSNVALMVIVLVLLGNVSAMTVSLESIAKLKIYVAKKTVISKVLVMIQLVFVAVMNVTLVTTVKIMIHVVV